MKSFKEEKVLIDKGDFTPANISRWMATLKDGESLDFSNYEGKVRIRLFFTDSSGKRRWIPLRNKIIFTTSPLPLGSTSLVSALKTPLKSFARFGKENEYDGTKRLNKSEKAVGMIRASMLAELKSIDLSSGMEVETHHGTYLEFDLGEYKLRTTRNGNPIAVIDEGELIYL